MEQPIGDKPVAFLKAQWVGHFTSWAVELTDDPRTREAMIAPPEWCPVPWDVPDVSVSVGDPRLEALFLSKVQLVFDFASGPPQEEAAVIEAQLNAAYDVEGFLQSAPPNPQPLMMQAELWAPGHVTASMYYDQAASPLGDATFSQVEQICKAVTRIELRHRIADLRSAALSVE